MNTTDRVADERMHLAEDDVDRPAPRQGQQTQPEPGLGVLAGAAEGAARALSTTVSTTADRACQCGSAVADGAKAVAEGVGSVLAAS